MKPREPLDTLLGRVSEPIRSEEYWREFPGIVADRMRRLNASPQHTRFSKTPAGETVFELRRWIAGLGLGLAAVLSLCWIMGVKIGRDIHTSPTPNPFAAAELDRLRRIYLELSTLFPGQLQGMVFEGDETRLVLSESASAAPGHLAAIQVCRPDGCFTVVTTTGQPVPVGRGVMDVLPDARGGIVVVGPDFAWRTGEPLPAGYTITLSPLEVSL